MILLLPEADDSWDFGLLPCTEWEFGSACDLQCTTVCEVAFELDIYSLVVHDCSGQDSMIQIIVSNTMFSTIQKYKIAGRWRMVFIWLKAVMHTVGESLHFSWSSYDLFMMNWYKQALRKCSSNHLKHIDNILRWVIPPNQDINFKGI